MAQARRTTKPTTIQATPTFASDTTLRETPQRTLEFLSAVGRYPAIRAALQPHGYDAAEHARGWSLLHATAGFVGTEPIPEVDAEVGAAIAKLDGWDEDGFRIVSASLRAPFPAQLAFLVAGIEPSTGSGAVVAVEKLLERIDQLERGTGRAATRRDDRKAVELLAKRGIGPALRKELRDEIAIAKRPAAFVPVNEAAVKRADDAHKGTLVALRVWYEEWADIARSAVKLRGNQIRLGLANRKSAARDGADDGGGTEGGGNAGGGAAVAGGTEPSSWTLRRLIEVGPRAPQAERAWA